MVEPIDMQNMLGRTPLVEKAVAARREDSQHVINLDAQILKQRLHQEDNVQLHPDTAKIEPKKDQQPKSGKERNPQPSAENGQEAPAVDWVQEAADVPPHRVDVDI